VGFLADLFMSRTYTCETCAARAQTISLLEEEIEMLREFLEAERDRNAPKHEVRGPVKEFEGSIRKSRIPWSRKQAQLEESSAREAARIEKELWTERMKKAEAAEPLPNADISGSAET
jgi:hypothetical protein